MAKNETRLHDAYDIDALKRCEIVITTQGGEYTKDIYPRCAPPAGTATGSTPRQTLRMNDDAVIVLDPVNLPVIQHALARGMQATTSAATAPSAAC